MHMFIEQNKKLLRFYDIALRLLGWLLLAFGLLNYSISIIQAIIALSPKAFAERVLSVGLLRLISLSLLGLGIAQLIRYFCDHHHKPGFILRNGDKFLYTYLILTIIQYIYYSAKFSATSNNDYPYFDFILSIILLATKALIIIGVAQFLTRVLPIIEEHKTLV